MAPPSPDDESNPSRFFAFSSRRRLPSSLLRTPSRPMPSASLHAAAEAPGHALRNVRAALSQKRRNVAEGWRQTQRLVTNALPAEIMRQAATGALMRGGSAAPGSSSGSSRALPAGRMKR
jgi:hypothetical protein